MGHTSIYLVVNAQPSVVNQHVCTRKLHAGPRLQSSFQQRIKAIDRHWNDLIHSLACLMKISVLNAYGKLIPTGTYSSMTARFRSLTLLRRRVGGPAHSGLLTPGSTPAKNHVVTDRVSLPVRAHLRPFLIVIYNREP
ncbi:hypothetical protein CBL_14350 [Carabus blaptoides fortunei]